MITLSKLGFKTSDIEQLLQQYDPSFYINRPLENAKDITHEIALLKQELEQTRQELQELKDNKTSTKTLAKMIYVLAKSDPNLSWLLDDTPYASFEIFAETAKGIGLKGVLSDKTFTQAIKDIKNYAQDIEPYKELQ